MARVSGASPAQTTSRQLNHNKERGPRHGKRWGLAETVLREAHRIITLRDSSIIEWLWYIKGPLSPKPSWCPRTSYRVYTIELLLKDLPKMTATAGIPFSHISAKPLHPTFGAEISGVDFSSPVSEQVFAEIYQAITKVRFSSQHTCPLVTTGEQQLRTCNKQYGVLVFRNTGLTDEGHIAFSRKFGELDDVTPYISAGRKHRLKYPELFDVSNVEADGSILDPASPRGQANKEIGRAHV